MEKSRFNTALKGRYVVGKKQGEGSYTEVYEAKDRLMKRIVAVKLLKRELKGDASILERFKATAWITARFLHPGVLAVLDIDETEPFFVMPLVETGDLAAFRTRREQQGKPVLAVELADFLYALSYVLLAAHKQGIVHSNLSPRNVLMAEPHSPLLTDFVLDRIKGSTFPKSLVASDTFPYLSPEQWEAKEVNPWADQYSLALVCYFLLTGKSPAMAARRGDTAAIITPDLFHECSAAVAQRFVRLLQRCLEKDEAKRFPTMMAIIGELNELRLMAFQAESPRPAPAAAVPETPPTEKAKTPTVPTPAPDAAEVLAIAAKEAVKNGQRERALQLVGELKARGANQVLLHLERETGLVREYQQLHKTLMQESVTAINAKQFQIADQKLRAVLQLDPANEQAQKWLAKLQPMLAKSEVEQPGHSADFSGDATVMMHSPIIVPKVGKGPRGPIVVAVEIAPPLASLKNGAGGRREP